MITHEQIHEYATFRFTAEASELGWEPGATPPAEIPTNTGNGLPFEFIRMTTVGTPVYRQRCGCNELIVQND